MKFQVSLTLILILLFASCKKSKEQDPEISLDKITDQSLNNIECFRYSKNNDTIFISLTSNDSIVSGNLTYNLFEKDRNKGNFKGEWKGDSLFADYEFKSEGLLSTREIFFFKTDSGLVEGYGPVMDTLNKVVFRDHSTLVLNQNILLKPVKCDQGLK